MRKRRHHIEAESKQAKKKSTAVKVMFGLTVLGLLTANIMIFASSVKLTDSITKLESDTQKVRKENEQLTQKLYSENSLAILEHLAEDMGFTKQTEPYYLDNTGYALAQ